MAGVKLPPHSLDSEKSVLGSLLMSKDALIEVAEILDPEMFYSGNHGLIYKAIRSLYEDREPIDVVTVGEWLKKRKEIKNVGGVAYLTELVNGVPTAAHAAGYARIIKDHFVKRQMIAAASDLTELAFDEGSETAQILDRAEQTVFSLSQRNLKKGFIHIKTGLAESFDRLDELHRLGGGVRGVPTGFKDLDDALSGFQESNLVVLAARPGMGKTSLAMNIGQYAVVEKKIPVGFFSLEMSVAELLDRMLVAQANIDAWKMKTGNLKDDDFAKLSEAMGILAESPMYIDDTPGISILEMRTKARRLQIESGVKLIIVDYLQLAAAGGRYESRVQEVGVISQGLKNLARELKVPVIAVSQLSRAIEQRGSKVPQLSDLRESGCLLGDTLVVRRDTGQMVKIEDLIGEKNVPILAMNEQMKLVPATFSRVFSSGKKKIFDLKLRSGKSVKASSNHSFFRVSGWTRLDQLKIGDRVAVARRVRIDGGDSLASDERLILLAHLIGDGCYLKNQPLHYTNSEKELIEIVKKAALSEFNVKPRIVPQESWYHLYLSAGFSLARGKRNPIVKWLDEELGIFNQRSREKVIPEVVFRLSSQKLALFLRHLWATDGCIHINPREKGPRVRVYYASGNRDLADQVAHLLLRLGILTTITRTKKAGYQDMWAVVVQGKTEQMKFLKLVGGVGEKKKKAVEAVKVLENIEENPNNDVVPKEVWADIEKARIGMQISTREFHKRMGWAYSGTQRHNNGLSRKRLRAVTEVLGGKKLVNLAESDLYWDEVTGIEEMGVEEVFDATVPGHACFLANDIVVHNSIEQDSDVVMFLYREEDSDLESFKLSIAKHRNGPLRTIDLKFRGDRIRFFGVDKARG